MKGYGKAVEYAMGLGFLADKQVREIRKLIYRQYKDCREFDFSKLPKISAAILAECAEMRENCQGQEISIISCFCESYPIELIEIADWPSALYVCGKLPVAPRVAIVGSRGATPYGIKVAQQLAYELTCAGVSIVSGLAFGIDRAAHHGAIRGAADSGNSAGVAVLAAGLDEIYPAEHRGLLQQLVGHCGAGIAEHPLGVRPRRHYFLQRNRLISGLSDAVIIVEAKERSGALSTVRHALEQGREVFAVPGRIDSQQSAGAHRLIQQGATLLRESNQIIEFLNQKGIAFTQRLKSPDGKHDSVVNNSPSAKLLALLQESPRDFDALVDQLQIKPVELLAIIGELELSGVVLPDSSGCFYICK